MERGVCGVLFSIVHSDPLVVMYAVTGDFGDVVVIEPEKAVQFVESDKFI